MGPIASRRRPGTRGSGEHLRARSRERRLRSRARVDAPPRRIGEQRARLLGSRPAVPHVGCLAHPVSFPVAGESRRLNARSPTSVRANSKRPRSSTRARTRTSPKSLTARKAVTATAVPRHTHQRRCLHARPRRMSLPADPDQARVPVTAVHACCRDEVAGDRAVVRPRARRHRVPARVVDDPPSSPHLPPRRHRCREGAGRPTDRRASPTSRGSMGLRHPGFGIDYDRPNTAVIRLRGGVARWVQRIIWHPSESDVWIEEAELLEPGATISPPHCPKPLASRSNQSTPLPEASRESLQPVRSPEQSWFSARCGSSRSPRRAALPASRGCALGTPRWRTPAPRSDAQSRSRYAIRKLRSLDVQAQGGNRRRPRSRRQGRAAAVAAVRGGRDVAAAASPQSSDRHVGLSAQYVSRPSKQRLASLMHARQSAGKTAGSRFRQSGQSGPEFRT